jgi:CDGSH-type Zn-finger protein
MPVENPMLPQVLELLSGTGRMVSRVTSARLCRCGGSSTKPFCDNTHSKNGFRSE